jgi:hypothetical protein
MAALASGGTTLGRDGGDELVLHAAEGTLAVGGGVGNTAMVTTYPTLWTCGVRTATVRMPGLIPARVHAMPPKRANGSTARGGIVADRWAPRGRFVRI